MYRSIRHNRLVHFVQAMLACQELRRREDGNGEVERIPVVTVRYDGVGPVGTARPRGWRTAEQDSVLPVYQPRRAEFSERRSSGEMPRSPPVVIARGDLGVEIQGDDGHETMSGVATPLPILEKPSRSEARSEKTLV